MSNQSKFISAMLHSDVPIFKPETKECDECHKIKHIDDFPKCTRSLDGRRRQCKQCKAIKSTARYRASKSERDFYKSMMPI